ncbi:Protein transport protein ssh1 [Pichia californica]|uniref:Protein transport protein ssh1 n=1 Tax=Pichia californica TaxID=460514 RepID=A0A9P6WPC1_9ASCO|nr:Protein transport protein ssh1 [[Candida] californica]KAG0690655.1 Protein transport protein ssh1 [[Candida] californica]
MSGLRILEFIKPFSSLIPEVELPYEKIIFDEKIFYTIGISAVYLLLSLPLTGVNPSNIADPFYWLRLPFASEAGTLLEFGVLPLVTSAFLWQILAGLKIIKVNFSNIYDRQFFQSLQKITAILIAIIYGSILAFSGYFQSIDSFVKLNESQSTQLWGNILIISQLTISTGIVCLLVELLEKGYGFGPGIMAFIAVNSATKFAGSLFGFITNIKTSQSNGAVIQLVRNIFNKSITNAIYDVFTRDSEINFTQIYLVIATLALISYFHHFRMDISIKSSKVRSMVSNYPIRLFYSGALPILFAYSLIYNINIIIFSLSKIFGPIPLIANWELNAYTNKTYELTSGILYFLSTSNFGSYYYFNIIKLFTFTTFITFISGIFGRNWYAMSGSSGKDLAKQFKDQDIVVIGHRDATVAKELTKMISSSSFIGSLILGSIIGFVESTGLSKGLVAGVVVGVLSALSLLESIMSEYQQSGPANSQFSQVFGI